MSKKQNWFSAKIDEVFRAINPIRDEYDGVEKVLTIDVNGIVTAYPKEKPKGLFIVRKYYEN